MAVAAVVLTGGASRRMGRDKARIAVDGVPMGVRTAALLAGVADPVVELGPGVTTLPHLADGGGGPLAALAAAGVLWGRLPGDGSVLVVATDLPRLDAGVLGWLASHPSATAVVPVVDGHPQPLCARYRVDQLRRLAAAPPASPRLLDWVSSLDPHLAAPAEWRPAAGGDLALADADTPEDLDALVGRSGW